MSQLYSIACVARNYQKHPNICNMLKYFHSGETLDISDGNVAVSRTFFEFATLYRNVLCQIGCSSALFFNDCFTQKI